MNVFFRADASVSIGTGHIMRCLTLAGELYKHGAKIFFICREEEGALFQLIKKNGYIVHALPAGIDLQTDRGLTREILWKQAELPDWLIVDHYELNADWESTLREFVNKIMVIDDLADRQHDCDILLDQNYNVKTDRYRGLVPGNCIRLLGPKFALLRPQFLQTKNNMRNRTAQTKRIFIFLGGADSNNQTCKVLNAVKMVDHPDIHIDVVIGPSNKYREKIEHLASKIPHTKCYHHIDNMAELMATADLGIGAAGTTSWERCCVGLPSITLVLAKNQIDIAKSLNKSGAVANLGWYNKINEADIKFTIESLLKDPKKTRTMSEAAKHIVDGLGTSRVAAQLKELATQEL